MSVSECHASGQYQMQRIQPELLDNAHQNTKSPNRSDCSLQKLLEG